MLMLKKLLKYEYKATSRIMLPLYVILVFTAALSRLGISLNDTTKMFGNDFLTVLNLGYAFMYAIMQLVMFFVCAIIGGATFVICIQRFYTNLLTDEGYLTNTLPVKAYQLVLSKLLVSLTWVIASVFVGALGFGIIYGDSANFFTSLINEIDINVLKGIVTFLIYVIYCILFFYLAMSLGQLVNRHKKWMSFGALVAINTGVSTVKMFIYILLSALNIDYMQDIMFNFYVNDVIMAVLSVVYFVLVTKILENKLNLE
jgi:hypothetical protein